MNSATSLIPKSTCKFNLRKGIYTNVTITTIETGTKPNEIRSNSVDPGWIFVCPEPLLLVHGLINSATTAIESIITAKERPTANERH
jgi:hypothetical protein